MDLLQGYGSSSDEEEDGKGQDTSMGEVESNSQNSNTAPEAKREAPPPAPTTATKTTTIGARTTTAARRARKMLSLQAVVPPHIFNQLQQQQQQNGNDSDDDDDDENDRKNDKNKNKKNVTSKSQQRTQDPGLQRLLNDLSGAATSNSTLSSNVKNPKSKSKPEIMGAAFLSATVITTKVSKNQQQDSQPVLDIHNPSPVVETVVKSDSDSDNDKDNNDNTTDDDPLAKKPSSNLPSKSKSTFAPPSISAAPRPRNIPIQFNAQSTSKAPPPVAPQVQQQEYDLEESQIPGNNNKNKKSRKEMEKLLRQGHLGQAMAATDMTQVEQEAPDGFTPQEETYASAPAHGVKAVATQMYNPTGGGAMTSQLRGRGKNQINALMHQAASLELQRARGQVPSASSGAASNPHRANAKRKYGW